MTQKEKKEMYENNRDVYDYVNKYAKKHNVDIDEALFHKVPAYYIDYVVEKQVNIEAELPNMWAGVSNE